MPKEEMLAVLHEKWMELSARKRERYPVVAVVTFKPSGNVYTWHFKDAAAMRIMERDFKGYAVIERVQ